MPDADAIRLIVGLGNPGAKYERTRHNAGFWFVDALSRACGGEFRRESKFDGDAARVSIEGSDLWLFKPTTFMNLSGRAVRLISSFYRIPVANTLVAYDEIDLPPGAARLKRSGGHGGHNGMRDLFAHVGQDFWRLRLGVGHPGHKDQVVAYVLSSPACEEQQAIFNAIDNALAVMPSMVAGEPEKAMHQLHTQ